MILEGYSGHKKCKCFGCVLVSGEAVQHFQRAFVLDVLVISPAMSATDICFILGVCYLKKNDCYLNK